MHVTVSFHEGEGGNEATSPKSHHQAVRSRLVEFVEVSADSTSMIYEREYCF